MTYLVQTEVTGTVLTEKVLVRFSSPTPNWDDSVETTFRVVYRVLLCRTLLSYLFGVRLFFLHSYVRIRWFVNCLKSIMYLRL